MQNKCNKKYKITIDDKNYGSDDPIISGLEILQIANKKPAKNFIIFQYLNSGQLEEIRHDEKVDLRDNGRETFILFERVWYTCKRFM